MNLGLIGLGAMGRNHYRVLMETARVDRVVVCDPQLDEKLPVPVYADVGELLVEEPLDAVIVAVPTTQHVEVASQVIRRGIPLLIEKPIAADVPEACRLVELANQHETLAAVGHVERFNPVVRSLLEELAGKEIYSIAVTRIGPFPPRIKDAGVLVDLSVHDIDLVHLLTHGVEVAEARAYKSVKLHGRHEDNAVITIRLENDVVATIVTNWLTPFKKRTIEVATDQAFYSADLISQELTSYSAYERDNSFVVKNCPVRKGEPLKAEIEAFLHFAETGDRDGLASLEDGLLTLETISRHRRSVPVGEP